jgi:DedD protein
MVTPAKGTSITVPPPFYQAPVAVPDTPAIPEFSQPGSVDAVDLVRNPADVPGLKEPPEGTKPQGNDFHVNDQQEKRPETLITVPQPSVVAVPNIAPAGKAAPRPVSKPSVTTPVVSKPVVSVSQSKPLVKVYDDFWVQTGAFSTAARAEGVKEELASKGITSIIDNRVVDGKSMFRVRVGPYTSNNEASYWLSLIKSIDGFESSQIRQTQSQR